MSKHILVTGGAGFIGSHLVERLLQDDHSVVVIDDFSTGREENLSAVRSNPRLKIIRSKVSTYNDLRDVVANAESIYHLAAAVGVELVMASQIHTIETNLHETEVILRHASEFKVPLLLTSTSEVYGKSQKNVFSEEDDLLIGPPHLSRWSYACSKLMDEFLAFAYSREKGLPITIARLFNTVGARQTGRYGMVLPRFIEAAISNMPLWVYGDGTQTRCFCSVHDTVEALIRLRQCSAATGQVFNVGSEEEISILELAKFVIKATGSKATVDLIPYSEAYAPGFEDMSRRRPNTRKLFETTGFRPSRRLPEIVASIVAARK